MFWALKTSYYDGLSPKTVQKGQKIVKEKEKMVIISHIFELV